MWFLWRHHARMPLHVRHDPTLSGQDQRAAARPHRYPPRSPRRALYRDARHRCQRVCRGHSRGGGAHSRHPAGARLLQRPDAHAPHSQTLHSGRSRRAHARNGRAPHGTLRPCARPHPEIGAHHRRPGRIQDHLRQACRRSGAVSQSGPQLLELKRHGLEPTCHQRRTELHRGYVEVQSTYMSRFSKTLIRLFLATVLIGLAAEISNAQAISRETPITKIREGAEAGNADAQLQLGFAYYKGTGVAQDDAEAARWFRKAADAGDATAQFSLGLAYNSGRGVSKDFVEAMRWYRKAADAGNVSAQLLLGVNYQVGGAVTQDYGEATRWYRKAADAGNADAQRFLGDAYFKGLGVKQDYAEGARWFRRAAEAGHRAAQCALGVAYRNGEGVTQDYGEAVRWLRKAADAGETEAAFYLGWAYEEGEGVTQDFAEGARWFRRAADAGNVSAQCKLGWAYQKGEGVPQNYILAHMWVNLCTSGSSGNEQKVFAESRDEIAQKMTPQEVAEAQRMAAEWKAKK